MTANTLPLDGPSAFEREVVNAIGLTVVDFWANWCGPCRALAPSLERLAASFAGRAKIAKVEVDVHPELAKRFAVRSIPTLVFFRDGREVERLVGNLPYPTLAERLARLTG
jgi:thioredoxin 1